MFFSLAGLLLIGLFFLAMFAVILILALSRSRAGQWILGIGAGLLGLMVLLFGLYFVSARAVYSPQLRAEREPPPPIEISALREIPLGEQAAKAEEPGAAEISQPGAAPANFPLEVTAVKPSTAPRRGAGRPDWMDSPMGRDGDVYRTIATAGPYSTAAECHEKLPEALQEAVRSYTERLLGADAGRRVQLPLSYIHERIVRGEWLEQAEFSFGAMYNLHERLEFDASVAKEIEGRYREAQVARRVSYAGVAAVLALSLIGVAFSYLKLDTLTRGYYTVALASRRRSGDTGRSGDRRAVGPQRKHQFLSQTRRTRIREVRRACPEPDVFNQRI